MTTRAFTLRGLRQYLRSRPLRWRLPLVVLVPLGIGFVILTLFSLTYIQDLRWTEIANAQEDRVNTIVVQMNAFMDRLYSIPLGLAESTALQDVVATNTQLETIERLSPAELEASPELASSIRSLRNRLAQESVDFVSEMSTLILRERIFDQVRFIGADGFEVMRVNLTDQGEVYVTPDEALQDKSDRYYFREARGLSTGEVYISQVDLNLERGELEIPYQPVIRFATPVFHQGQFAGLIVINVKADDFFRLVGGLDDQVLSERQQDAFMIDAGGYYMVDTREGAEVYLYGRDLAFEGATVESREPELAARIIDADEIGMSITDQFVTAVTFSPFGGREVRQVPWTLVVLENQAEVMGDVTQFGLLFLGGALGVLFVVSLVLMVVSRGLVNPLESAVIVADEIAAGNLNARIEVQATDEVGRLSQAVNTMTTRLATNIATLEERVNERTRDLEVVSEIASVAVGLRDLDTMLERTVNLIRDRFDFYHVQIFLNDELDQMAWLAASTGEAGRILLDLRWSLPVGSHSVIGQTTATGENLLVYDTHAVGAAHRPNPHLPDTRAEMALPLKVGDRVIGALDIQSVQPHAFTERDVHIFEILVRQLAVAVENVRLLDQTDRQVGQMRELNRLLTRSGWDEYLTIQHPGEAEIYFGLGDDHSTDGNGDGPQPGVATPIRVRDEVIGVLNTTLAETETFDEDELALIQAVSERVALAVENARLVTQTQSLFAQTQSALTETETLYQTSRALSPATTNAEILKALQDNFGHEDRMIGLLFLGDERDERGLAHTGRMLIYVPEQSTLSEIALGDLDSMKGPLATPEAPYYMMPNLDAIHATFPPAIAAPIAQIGIQALAMFALSTGPKISGFLTIAHHVPYVFSQREMEIFQALAGQVATVLNSRQLFEDVQSEQQTLRSVLDTMPTAVLVLDPDGHTTLSNEQAIELLGGEADLQQLAAGQKLFRPESDEPYELADLPAMRAIETREAILAENLAIIQEDGWRIDVINNAAPILDQAGNVVAAVAVFQDISELRELQNALQETLSETTSMYEASKSVLSGTDPEAIAESALDHVVQNLDPDVLQVLLAVPGRESGDGDEVTVLMAQPHTFAERIPYPPETRSSQYSMVVHDVADDPRLSEEGRAMLVEAGIASLLVTPLSIGGEVAGWLALGFHNAHDDALDQQRFVESLSDQVAVALQNAQLRQQTEVALGETLTLYSASREIARAETAQEIVESFVSYALPPDASHIMLFVFAKAPGIELAAHVLADWNRLSGATPTTSNPVIPISRDDVSYMTMLEQEQPVLIGASAQDDGLVPTVGVGDPLMAYLSIRGAEHTQLALPLFVGERLVGALHIGYDDLHEHSDREMRVYQSLVDQVATAVENRRLLEQTQESLAQTERLYQASALIAAASEPTDFVRAVMDTLSGEATATAISLYDRPLLPGQKPRWMQTVATGTRRGVRPANLVLDFDDDSPELAGLESLMNGEPLLLHPFEDETAILTERTIKVLRLEDTHTVALFGLRAGGRLLGMLTVTSNQPYRLSEEDISTYTALADQIGVALQSRNLLTETQRLYEASQAIRSASTVRMAMIALQSTVMDYEPLRMDVYFLQSGEADAGLDRVYHWEKSEDASQTVAGATELYGTIDFPKSVLERPPIYIERRGAVPDDSLIRQYLDSLPEQEAIVSIPLRLRNQPVGRLVLTFGEEKRFAEADRQYLTAVADQSAVIVDNYQLFERMEESLDETRALYDISSVLAEANTPQDILRAIVEYAASSDITQARLLILHGESWDADGAMAEVAASLSQQENPDLTGMRFTADQYPGWEELATNAFIAIEDVNEDTTLSEDSQMSFWALGIISLVVIPLATPDGPLGAILLGTERPRKYSERQLRIYRNMTDMVTIALQNTRLLEQVQHRARQLQTSAQISHAVTSILNIDELLSRVVDLILESFGYDHAQVFLLDEEQANAVLQASTGEAGRTMLSLNWSLGIGSESVIGQVTATAKPVIALDTASAEVPHRPNPHLPDTRSEMAVPLIQRGRVLGALDVQSKQSNAFSEEDVTILTSLADQVAVALGNARLFEEAENATFALSEQVQNLEWLLDAGRTFTTALQASEILDMATRYVTDLLGGVDHCGIVIMTGADRTKATVLAEYPETGAVGVELKNYPWWKDEFERTGQPIIVDNVATTQMFGEDIREFLLGVGTLQLVIVPLIAADGKLLGSIGLDMYETRRAFTRNELTLLQLYATQLAAAYQNVQLFEAQQSTARDLEEQVQNLEWLLDAGRTFTTALQASEILDTAVRYIINLLRVDHCGIAIVAGDDQTKATVMADYPETGSVGVELTNFNWWQDEFERTGLPVVIEDVANETERLEPELRNELLNIGTLQLAVVPLIAADGRLLGSIGLDMYEVQREFTRNELTLLQLYATQLAAAYQNVQLFEAQQITAHDLEEQVQRLENLHDISLALTQTLNTSEILSATTENLVNALRLDACWINVFDPSSGRQGTVVAEYPSTGLLDWQLSVSESESYLIRLVATDDRPVIMDDIASLPEEESIRAVLLERGVEVIVMVPLKAKGVLIGVIGMEMYRPRDFTSAEITLIQTITTQVGLAYNSAQLYDQAQRTADEMSFLFTVTTAATSFGDLEHSMQNVVNLISVSMENDLVVLFLIDERDGKESVLRPLAYHGFSPQMVLEEIPVGVGASVLDDVIATRRPLVVPDFAKTEIADVLAPGLGSMMAAPLLSGESFVGVLALFKRETYAYNDDNVRLLQTLSSSLSAIVENNRLLNEVQAANERLRELDKLKSQFLANMSHELRTPLNSIIGFSRVILKGIDGPLTEMQQQDLDTINSSGNHLLTLINDILDQAKIESDKVELNIVEFDLKTVVEAACSMTVGLIKERPIRLNVELEAGLPPVWGDEIRTRQILINLLNNASKFTQEGSITITGFVVREDDDNYVQISVTDTGIGIPEGAYDIVFNQFEQVDGSLTRITGGTGLGLPISKRLVEMQGGEIWLESTVDVGSTFSFTMPAFAKVQPKSTEERAEKSDMPQSTFLPTSTPVEEELRLPRKIVLVVDSQVGMHQLYRRYLNKAGYTVEAVADPLQAHERVVLLRPEVVLLDVNMPDMDGWQILQRLKDDDNTFDIPIVVCSMNTDTERAFRLGAAGHLVKPFLEEDLVETMIRMEAERLRYRILIIDDKPETIRLIREWLKTDRRFEILEATSGQQGLDIITQKPPDLVLLDLNMPGLDGIEVLAHLRDNPETQDLPVLIITADDDMLAAQADALVGVGVYSKNTEDETTLLDNVRDLLENDSGS